MNCDGVSNLLSAYLDGELSPGELLRVEEHLRRCHACADEVDSLRQTIALVASLEEVEVPVGFGMQLHQRLVAVGPPTAAVRRAPAAPAWQRNVRRWAVPAAAAAAALAIGLTSYDSVSSKLPGIISESNFKLTPPKTDVAVENPGGTVATTATPTAPQTTPSQKPPATSNHQELPVTPPGKTVTGPDETKAVTTPDVKPPTPAKTETKYMVHAATVTVNGPLDPKIDERMTKDNTRVEKGNNTRTIIVPQRNYQEWLKKVTQEYFPGSTFVDASQSRDAAIASALERYETARLQKTQEEKANQPTAIYEQVMADAQAEYDMLIAQTQSATIVVTFTAP